MSLLDYRTRPVAFSLIDVLILPRKYILNATFVINEKANSPGLEKSRFHDVRERFSSLSVRSRPVNLTVIK